MAKKEKAPKVKKEKPPKKQKEPKVKKEKGGKKKLPLILIPVLLLLIGALVFLLLTGRLGKKTKIPDEPPPEETETLVEEPAPEPEEEKAPEPTMTVDETVDFILTLSPSLLGLEGDTMEGYTAHTTSGVYPVDGLLCTQVNVYKHNAAGTNDIQGCYLLSRGSVRRLYRLDPETREVTEIPLE